MRPTKGQFFGHTSLSLCISSASHATCCRWAYQNIPKLLLQMHMVLRISTEAATQISLGNGDHIFVELKKLTSCLIGQLATRCLDESYASTAQRLSKRPKSPSSGESLFLPAILLRKLAASPATCYATSAKRAFGEINFHFPKLSGNSKIPGKQGGRSGWTFETHFGPQLAGKFVPASDFSS